MVAVGDDTNESVIIFNSTKSKVISIADTFISKIISKKFLLNFQQKFQIEFKSKSLDFQGLEWLSCQNSNILNAECMWVTD